MRYPEHLLKLISVLRKLPGVGTKSAERFAFHLLDWPEEKLQEMAKTLVDIKKNLLECPECGALMGKVCPFCDSSRRQDILCIVSSVKDVFAIEETREYKGLYHVIKEIFSPLQGKIPDPKALNKLKERILSLGVQEIVIALDATLEGDATALYLKKELETFVGMRLSRLALGLPIGSPLEYIDGGTLARAFLGRQSY